MKFGFGGLINRAQTYNLPYDIGTLKKATLTEKRPSIMILGLDRR